VALYAKVNTSTNIIEAVGSDNSVEDGYHFREFVPSCFWGAELIGLTISSEQTTLNGFPHENLLLPLEDE
jgi:hypothetical protein